MIIVLDLPEPLSVPFHLLGDSSLECSQTPFTNFDHVDYDDYDNIGISRGVDSDEGSRTLFYPIVL